MVEMMRRDFNEHHMTQVPMIENQLGEMKMMEELAEHVGKNYPEVPDSRFVAQPVDDFVFPSEEAGSAENPITIDEDDVPRNNDDTKHPSTTTTSNGTSFISVFIENLQNPSAAQQLFDSLFLKKKLLFGSVFVLCS